MDAIHFRHRAARAREMAQSGDDIRLSRMLLEVAIDLDAEAEAIEAQDEQDASNRNMPRGRSEANKYGALLHSARRDQDIPQVEATPIEIVNLSVGGVKFRIPRILTPGSQMMLELPQQAIRLDGTIVSVFGADTTMVFDPGSRADPGLSRLLQPRRAMA